MKHLPLIVRSLALVDCEVRATMRAVVAGEKPWPLFMTGQAGVGKTCAALCLLDLVQYGEYFTVADLCEKLTNAAFGRLEWSQGGRGGIMTATMFRRCYLAGPELLVLDELGLRDSVSDAHYETVYRTIELRLGKPFIVISNHGLDQLGKIYDDRTASRLVAGTVIEIGGEDRRLA